MLGNPEEGYALSIVTSYDANGPHYLTVSGTGSRSTTGTTWAVTVAIGGVAAETQPCSSSVTSCTATVGAYLSPFQAYSLSAIATRANVMVASASDGAYASCD
jgi:hypothetical protein